MTGSNKQCLSASCTDPSARAISRSLSIGTIPSANSASSLLSSMATGSPEAVRSSRDTASPPCMTVATAGCPETTVARRTRNEYTKETYENLYTENGISTTNNNEVLTGSNPVKVTLKPHVANTLPASATNRKMGNGIFATASPSSATKIKCSKNEDNNTHSGSDSQRHNCPLMKTLSSKHQGKQLSHRPNDSMIQPTPEIAARCENSAGKCKKALKDMNKLLRTSRGENFWHQWTLQEMGLRISQSEYNAAVIPAGLRKQFNQVTNMACTPRPRVFTPNSGNVKSTTLSTETARSRSSPPACAHASGLTFCQAKGSRDELERRHPSFIRSHTVIERTPIARTFTTPMSTPVRSSFQSLYNSSFQNYTHRLPVVRMARTKQTARKVRDDRQRGRARQQEGDRRRDRSNTPPRRARPRSPSPDRLECVFCGLISYQRRNHRRHLITKHNCRPDGTPATAADIEEARREDPEQPTRRDARYKSREFIERDSDDETTPIR